MHDLRLPKSGWSYNQRYNEVATAHFWGILPGEYWSLPVEEQAYMIEYYETELAIAAKNEHERHKAVEKSG